MAKDDHSDKKKERNKIEIIFPASDCVVEDLERTGVLPPTLFRLKSSSVFLFYKKWDLPSPHHVKTITSIIRICLYHSCFRGGAVHPTSPNGQLGKFFFKISRNIWSGEFHNDDRVRPNDIALGVEERVHTTHIKYSIEFQFFLTCRLGLCPLHIVWQNSIWCRYCLSFLLTCNF